MADTFQGLFQHLEDMAFLNNNATEGEKQRRRLTMSCEKYIGLQKERKSRETDRRTSDESTLSNVGMLGTIR